MNELPLHPALVHFPIGIGMILPLIALSVWFAIRKHWIGPRSWLLVVVLQLVLLATSIFAVRSGGHEEERVEKVVKERYIETHEELAERVPWMLGGVLAVTLLGLWPNEHKARIAQTLACVGMVGAAMYLLQVGRTGGALVYEHGAANAYTQPNTPSAD